MRKIRVGIVFGGRSGEHEVSLASARSVLAALDRTRYEPVAIGITRDGKWLLADSPDRMLAHNAQSALPEAGDRMTELAPGALVRRSPGPITSTEHSVADVIFPVLHGPYGEDGKVQGLLEMGNVPYVGSEVMASALAMDKEKMKTVFAADGLPQVPYILIRKRDWRQDGEQCIHAVESVLQYPVFVKPCNLGSSVGISKADSRDELGTALEWAARYDRRLIVEQGIDAREVECGVLGNDDPQASVVGEIVAHRNFYDYEAKYTAGLADLIIPANVSPEQSREIRRLAIQAFTAIDASGLARVDFFIRRDTGEILINELNTMPGFTATSMYPKLWAASGLSYDELIDRLIQLAFERHTERQKFSVSL